MSAIEWAPLLVPMNRRLQTLSAGVWMFSLVFGEMICTMAFVALLIFGNTVIRALCVAYLIYLYRTWDIGEQGGIGVGIQWMRRFIAWKYFRDYFPINLVKTVDLRPDRNYIFAAFPHGILSCGVFSNFATDFSQFKEYFPGLRPKILTLSMHFHVPFFRDMILSWGVASASADCLRRLLYASNNSNNSINADGYTGNAAIILVGGAQEALYSRPNNYQILLKKRKGFVKIAIETGCPIVPVFSFGEVELFDQASNPPGSSLRRFQEGFKKITGVSPAIFIGRGFFQYSFGIIPRRKPITTVVGQPIEVKQSNDPTSEEIEELHSKFVAALVDLFETHKAKYVPNADNLHLIIE